MKKYIKTHHLKVVQPHFNDLLNGTKTNELRKNDRDFKVGDSLFLSEWNGKHVGNIEVRTITHILKDCEEYGLKNGFVILSLR